MFLGQAEPLSVEVQYGDAGFGGQLGYLGLYVTVQGRHYVQAISTHPYSCMEYAIGEGHEEFQAYVAMNDTAWPDVWGNFYVYVDGNLVAAATRVGRGQAPRLIQANVKGGRVLRLVVEGSGNSGGCHAVWIEPRLEVGAQDVLPGCIGGLEIVPQTDERVSKCVAVICTPDFAEMCDNMLGSLWMNGQIKDAKLVVLATERTQPIELMAAKYNATLVDVKITEETPTFRIKSALYSIARIIHADAYLCLDVDMLVLGSLADLLDAVPKAMPDSIFAVAEQGPGTLTSLWRTLFEENGPYMGHPADAQIFAVSPEEYTRTAVVNGGLFGGSRRAMLALDNMMRSLQPGSFVWERAKPAVRWREQGVFNITLARLGSLVEIAPTFNVQLQWALPAIHRQFAGDIRAALNGQNAHIIHFNGATGRGQYEPYKGDYRLVYDPKFGNKTHAAQKFHVECEQFFTANREPSSCLALMDDKSFWNMTALYEHLYSVIASRTQPSVLELDTFAGIAGKYAAKAVASKGGTILSLRAHALKDDGPGNIIGDVADEAMKLKDAGNKYDNIVIDTHHNPRYLRVMFQMCYELLAPGGVLLVLDVANPISDIRVLNAKLIQLGCALERYIPNPSGVGGLYVWRQ